MAGVGSRVHVYKSRQGMLMHTLKGHKDAIYAAAYARDGQRFATGGADKTVIVWSRECVGLLKFSHTSPVNALAYNPVTQQLASAACDDIGLWHPEQSSVQKIRIHAKVRPRRPPARTPARPAPLRARRPPGRPGESARAPFGPAPARRPPRRRCRWRGPGTA